jgi:hypothetical protein
MSNLPGLSPFPPCSCCGSPDEFTFGDLLRWVWRGIRHWRGWPEHSDEKER